MLNDGIFHLALLCQAILVMSMRWSSLVVSLAHFKDRLRNVIMCPYRAVLSNIAVFVVSCMLRQQSRWPKSLETVLAACAVYLLPRVSSASDCAAFLRHGRPRLPPRSYLTFGRPGGLVC